MMKKTNGAKALSSRIVGLFRILFSGALAGVLLTSVSAVTLPNDLQITDENPMKMPAVGSYGLRVLSPNLLELTLITTKQPDPAGVTEWNFVNNNSFSAPSTSQFAVTVNGQNVGVQSVGFKRRPLYAPLQYRDLRIANHLYLQLSSSIADGKTVEVKNPSGQLWNSSKQF